MKNELMNGSHPSPDMVIGQVIEEFADPLTDVATFQHQMGHGYDGPPRMGEPGMRAFRIGFLLEEVREIAEALGVTVKAEVTGVEDLADLDREAVVKRLGAALDGHVDLDYVLIGTLRQLGLSAVYGEAWCRVHRKNMLKVPGIKETRGFAKDVVKPDGWTAPELDDLVVRLFEESEVGDV